MTQSFRYELKCSCGEVFESELYESINATINPDLMGKLFNDELNVVKCPSCGHEIKVDIPLLYHDMKQKLMVYYFPEDFEGIKEANKSFRKKIINMMKKHSSTEGYEYDVAIGMEELNRKVLWRNY